jgi:hypothetical protein
LPHSSAAPAGTETSPAVTSTAATSRVLGVAPTRRPPKRRRTRVGTVNGSAGSEGSGSPSQ